MTIVKSQIRRGPISQMPILDAGELGLASDENRVFVGTEPITGSFNTSDTTDTNVFVTFDVNLNGNSIPIDLDNVNSNSYKIFIDDAEATQFDVQDTVVTISHGLANAAAANAAVYKIKINEELTNNTTNEGSKTSVQHLQFQKTPADTDPEEVKDGSGDKTITFDSNVKNSVFIEYYVYTNTMSRNGQMRISVNPDMSPTATITDTYDQTGSSDLVFSIDTGKLMFNTTSSEDHAFTYKQTSFAKRPIV